MSQPPAWVGLDPPHLWHPYAPAPDAHPAWPVAGAQGCRLMLADGRELIDGMASWWCAIHGYGAPTLVQAITAQTQELAHVMFGGLTHEPAARLAARLAEVVPGDLSRVFFCDSGSVAVEVAMKMALQYWQAEGQPEKDSFLALRGGYHGDTFSTMSVSDPDGSLQARFPQQLPVQHFTPRPPPPGCSDETLEESLAQLDSNLRTHQTRLAGLILEPILQGAGGFYPYDPRWLTEAAKYCREQQVLLIADEIATGFGRTGRLFACEHADVVPDLLCIGKALTGGMLSLAATLTREDLAHTISQAGPLLHGPTFMANPTACRVALASLDLLLQSDWKGNVTRIERGLREQLMPLAHHRRVAEVRIQGAFAVVETLGEVDVAAWGTFAVERGVWLRPYHRYVYLMPPFIVSDEELKRLTDTVHAGLEAWPAFK